MKFGVVFPQTEIGADPIAVRDFVQTAEALGYHHLLSYEHVIGANRSRPEWQDGRSRPYDHESMFHEIFVLFGYLAGLTESIILTTGILIAPQRQTALVAKQAAEVDVLSGGRLRLGVGVGWNEVEYQALNKDFSQRGKIIEEQVALMRELWSKPLVTFEGDFHTVIDAGINPRPASGSIPVWMGGSADVVIRRMAKMADGWFIPGSDLEQTRSLLDTLKTYLDEEGRSFADFGLEYRLSMSRVPESEWQSFVQNYGDLGISEMNVYPSGDTPAELITSIEKFHKAML